MQRLPLLSSALLALAISLPAWGQGGLGSIEGDVLDPAGAVMPDVAVTATNVETQLVRTATTNSAGRYALLRIPPGTYTVSVEHAGFKHLEYPGIQVQVGDRITLNVPLQIGQVSDSVSVVAEAPLVRTEDAQTGEVIDNRMIQSLPQLNRDPLALIRLAGNVQGDGDRATAGNTLRINGGRTQGIDYFVDGVTVGTGMGHGVSYNTPTTEAVAEFRVITNGISAEYGRISGGAVELVTKAGTNALHGQLFEYDKNRAFNSNSWRNNKEGKGKDNFQENLYGGAVGGPVIIPKIYNGKDKTFFFFNYEGYKFRQGGALQYGSVPTQAMRNGDFTNVCLRGTCAKFWDQNGPVAVDPTDGKTYRQNLLNDGFHILPSQMNPIAVAALKFVPLPNHAPDAGTTWSHNYVGTASTKTDRYDWALRVDQNFGPRHKFFARFNVHDWVTDPLTQWFGPGQAVEEKKNKGMWGQTLNYDWIASPTLILSVRAGAYHTPYSSGSTIDPSVSPALPFDAVTRSLLGPTGSVQLWAPDMTPMIDSPSSYIANSTTYNANVSMVKTLNKHMLRFGYEHRRYYDNFTNGASGYMLTTGRTVKRGAFDSGWNDEDFVNSFGGFLQGYVSHQGVSGMKTRAMNFNYHAAYLQDEWKIMPKLNVGLGLRWDIETPVTERGDKLYFFDPTAPSPFTMKPGYNWSAELSKGLIAAKLDPALASQIPTPDWVKNGFPKGAARVANSPEFKSRYGTGYHPNQFSPRLSVAYELTPKTALRSSFGMMYISRSGDENALSSAGGGMALTDSYGELWHVNDPNVPYYKMSQTLTDPFRPQDLKHYVRDNQAANVQVTGGDPTLIAYATTSKMPHEYTWNVNVQRQLSPKMVVEVGYNGNHGVDLLGQDLISHFPAAEFVPSKGVIYNNVSVANPVAQTINYPTPMPLPILQYPYPYFGPISIQGLNIGRSMFNGMSVRLQRNMSNGYAFLVNYTLSRTSDNVGGPNTSNGGIVSGGTGGHTPQSVMSVADIYGISPIDQTHRIRAYYQVQFPFGKGRKWLSSRSNAGGKILDFVAGGWELAGISSWTSGVPISIPGSNANNKPSRMEYTWSSYTGSNHDLSSTTYGGMSSVFYSSSVDPSVRQAGPRRLDPTKIINPDQSNSVPFQLGNIDPVYSGIRQPWGIYHDLSLMKSFSIREGIFLQVRAEAENAFNMRGWPSFVTDPRSSDYGLMIAENDFNHSPRRIQLSARLVF
jgi:hypothetical protein